jgi:hypothetical protein
MRRYLAFGFMALFFASSGALAQPSPESQAPESSIQAGIALLKASRTMDNLNAVFEAIAPQEKAQIKRAAPSLSDAAIDTIVQTIRTVVMGREDELLRLNAIEYARHFTEQELKDLAAFYESDLGKKYISEVPNLIRETSPVMVRWLQGVMAQELPNLLKALPPQEKKA